MAEPPPDVDAELFIIGEGSYDNLRTWMATSSGREFRIDPRPMPVWSIVFQNILIVAVCCILQWAFLKSKLAGGDIPKYAVTILGALVCLVYTLVAVLTFRSANQGGTWFIYDLQRGQLELPREGETFDRREVIHLQYITTHVAINEARSELNLITFRAGKRERWPILRSLRTYHVFDDILRPLVVQTGLPVMRVTNQCQGGEVSQQPWTSD